jgi:hypothetical protein
VPVDRPVPEVRSEKIAARLNREMTPGAQIARWIKLGHVAPSRCRLHGRRCTDNLTFEFFDELAKSEVSGHAPLHLLTRA